VAGFRIFGIECIHHVPSGGDKHGRSHPDVRERQSGYDQRLCIDLPIDVAREDLAKSVHIDVALTESGLIEIGSGAGRIVAVGQHVDRHFDFLRRQANPSTKRRLKFFVAKPAQRPDG
jgi:hypothetical protein